MPVTDVVQWSCLLDKSNQPKHEHSKFLIYISNRSLPFTFFLCVIEEVEGDKAIVEFYRCLLAPNYWVSLRKCEAKRQQPNNKNKMTYHVWSTASNCWINSTKIITLLETWYSSEILNIIMHKTDCSLI